MKEEGDIGDDDIVNKVEVVVAMTMTKLRVWHNNKESSSSSGKGFWKRYLYCRCCWPSDDDGLFVIVTPVCLYYVRPFVSKLKRRKRSRPQDTSHDDGPPVFPYILSVYCNCAGTAALVGKMVCSSSLFSLLLPIYCIHPVCNHQQHHHQIGDLIITTPSFCIQYEGL